MRHSLRSVGETVKLVRTSEHLPYEVRGRYILVSPTLVLCVLTSGIYL